jgi:signal transduction histidine kinase
MGELKTKLFRGLSIQQRLPLLICTLLLCVIITFTWTSYFSVKNASLKAGQVRIKSLTEQLAAMFGQSSQSFLSATRQVARGDSIKNFLLTRKSEFEPQAIESLKKLHKDSLSLLVELLDKNKATVLRSGWPGVSLKVDSKNEIEKLFLKADSGKIGKVFVSGDSVIYAVAASVTDNKEIIGYVIRWRLLKATSKAIEQFSKLIGTNATLYIGNNDGSIWSDLQMPVEVPAMDTASLNQLFEFPDFRSTQIVAASQAIPNSPWRVLIGFPKKTILESSIRFFGTSIIIGSLLIIIAMLAAWFTTRNITRPLKKLTKAATAIAYGDYSTEVPIDRNDELGKLARAFNAMRVKVQDAHSSLEKKVKERTTQLQASNKELEAFSYSVSHDLRAPLRAIGGYSMILKEEYGSKLDDEANRLTDKIISNAQMMGQLIDSLIAFSQMGATEITHNSVDMEQLAKICISELLQNEPTDKYAFEVKAIPPCYGDPNLIKQVWMNLVSNAIKYSSKIDSPAIEIGCTEESNMNIYYVKDNGVGFAMNHAQKLFGVFQRLHHKRDYEGTGIGLAFTKRIINRHGGDIWAESTPGNGATFYFSLPVSKKNNIVQRKIVYEPTS